MDVPLVGQPEGQLADGNQWQIDQQLRDISLRIDVMAAAGAGQAGKDGRCSSCAQITDEEAAKILSISVRSVDYLLANRQLSSRRIGTRNLIPVADLKRFARMDHPERLASLSEESAS